MSGWLDGRVTEDQIDGSLYDEINDEGDIVLRNLIDFAVYDSMDPSSHDYMPLDQLDSSDGNSSSTSAKTKPKGVVVGTVILPLPYDTIEDLSSKLCAYIDPNQQLRADQACPEDQEKALAEFDKSALKVGDRVDGYCLRDSTWYPSVIVAIDATAEVIYLFDKTT
jgi:hypothetical protein